ncbi:DUF1453 domain-containing protein [Brevundimonas sp.]|uniref:DUF1453 domain-containing protein n=1 Tax=Brevundimonas sp. TaxID=1871086 RepID=UPI002FCB2CE2
MTTEQLIPLIVIAIVLPLVLLRNRRPRTLNLRWMWVVPALVVVLIGFGLWATITFDPAQAPFRPIDFAVLAAGLALGVAAGWQRGRMVVIHKDPDGALKAQASPLGLILIVVLLLGRQGLRAVLEPHAADWGLNILAVQDAFMLLAVGLVVAQRLEIYIRARRILAGKPDAHLEAP